jgi:hypothetical protein
LPAGTPDTILSSTASESESPFAMEGARNVFLDKVKLEQGEYDFEKVVDLGHDKSATNDDCNP